MGEVAKVQCMMLGKHKAHSDSWNRLYSPDKEIHLVRTAANTIIKNTSCPREADDFWSRAELNPLMALLFNRSCC